MPDPLFEPSAVEEPHDHYARLRAGDPVHLVEEANTYLVTRMDLVHQVVADTETYSSNTDAFLHVDSDGTVALRDALGEVPIDGPGAFAVVATADPPTHTRQRRVLMRVLAKGVVERREVEIRSLVDHILDPCLDRGAVEWMGDVAAPLPAVVVARILGLDDDLAPFLLRTGFASVEQIGGFATSDRRNELRDLITELGPVATAYERARAGDGPGPDTVLGACADAVAAGEMDDLEAIATLMLIVSAGTESTTSLLGTAVRLLAERGDLQQRLRREPHLVDAFVEEACRIDPPFRGHYRRATRDTDLAGVPIPAGARLVLVWPAANRDPASFSEPEEIRLDRAAPRQHVGFGWGIHLCVGAPLARLEARLTCERLLARTSRFTLAVDSAQLAHHRSLMIRRLTALPLRLEV